MEHSNLISPSPDFPITKPGMHLNRKRAKPLRTYGKRPPTTTTDSRGEPPTKKRKSGNEPPHQLSENKENEAPSDAPVTKEPEEPASSKDKEPEEKVAKGSILSYFKRAAPKVASQPSKGGGDEHTTVEEPSAPSRVKARRRKGPRLLRIRQTLHPDTHDDEDHEDHEQEEESKRKLQRRRTTGKTNEVEAEPPHDKDSGVDRERGSSEDSPAPISRPKLQPTVQTTLNISSQAPFSECKVCDTVWNPLYPDDVKYHAKRHRAVVALSKRANLNS